MRNSKMKRIFKLLSASFLFASTIIFTSCLSLGIGSSKIRENPKIENTFEGTMDTRCGYENLLWGTTYRKIDKNIYPLSEKNSEKNSHSFCCYIGKSEHYEGYNFLYKYGHGDVNETLFYFDEITGQLYYVIDTLCTQNPTLEYLHSRYGDFNEVDVSTKPDKYVLYTNKNIADNPFSSLFIYIYKDTGITYVHIKDFYGQNTYNDIPRTDKTNREYANASEKDKVLPNKWYCYSSTDGNRKVVDFTFLNQNDNGKFLLVGYTKSLESPSLSQVRAGICWINNTSGTYEIKTKEGINTAKYDTSHWNCVSKDESYTYTKSNSTRNMIKFFLENESFTVRHNNEVSSFASSGLLEELSRYGITTEELDFAIANEEF